MGAAHGAGAARRAPACMATVVARLAVRAAAAAEPAFRRLGDAQGAERPRTCPGWPRAKGVAKEGVGPSRPTGAGAVGGATPLATAIRIANTGPTPSDAAAARVQESVHRGRVAATLAAGKPADRTGGPTLSVEAVERAEEGGRARVAAGDTGAGASLRVAKVHLAGVGPGAETNTPPVTKDGAGVATGAVPAAAMEASRAVGAPAHVPASLVERSRGPSVDAVAPTGDVGRRLEGAATGVVVAGSLPIPA